MKFLIFLLMICGALFLFSNSDAQFLASKNLASLSNQIILNQDSTISEDAIILALRLQDSIKLDSLLASKIDQVLEIVRTQFDTLRFIHAMKEYEPNQILLKSNASWIYAWRNGELMTGNPDIDSLSTEYQMIDVEVDHLDSTLFILYFSHPLKMPLLAELYQSIQGVEYAQPNWVYSIGMIWTDIGIFWLGDWNIAFGRGEFGCDYCWFIKVDGHSNVRLVAEESPIYGHSATFFSSVDDLLSIAQSAESELDRIIAVEVIGLLYINKCPWSREDIRNFASFCSMKEEAYFMREQVVKVLIGLLGNPNPIFQYSIQIALNRVLSLGGGILSYYFPFQVENWWTFSKFLTETIVDTIRVNDSLYFQFDQFRHSKNILLRMTSDNKLLLSDKATEQVWLDFSANIGDSWKVSTPFADWTVHLQSKTDTVTVLAGTFTHCYRFWFQFHGDDNDWVEWYAPGVGPVRRILYGFAVIEYPLTSAFVNGYYLPTKIGELPESSKPDQFYLYPNYPNPFNATTVISYELPISESVKLEIFNIHGQKVRTLINYVQVPGHYQIIWDGCNDNGRQLGSGLYFCRLQVKSFIKAQKLIYQK